METILSKIEAIDWDAVTESMHQDGYALVPDLLNHQQCESLIENYDDPVAYRKTVVMERYRFGLGEYKYFNYPLPDLIQQIRTRIYSKLAPIANTWFKALNNDKQFPLHHVEL